MKDKENTDIYGLSGLSLPDLISKANKIRADYIGERLDLCTIFNAKSGLCPEDCKFCAQSARHATGVQTYPLRSKDEMIKSAKNAKAIGAERFGIVTSGNRLNAREIETICQAIEQIKNEVGMSVCASLGALRLAELKNLKSAGLSRYHHNIETSENYYPKIVSTHSFKERTDTIASAKTAGLEVCSGGIIGMGESWQDRIDMANLLKELNVDSVPLNILVPIKGTPFENLDAISCMDVIKTICIFRIILQDKTIKIAAGRESVLKDFQAMGFMAGANGMLIGGYLTIAGREVAEDHKLIAEIEKLWKE